MSNNYHGNDKYNNNSAYKNPYSNDRKQKHKSQIIWGASDDEDNTDELYQNFFVNSKHTDKNLNFEKNVYISSSSESSSSSDMEEESQDSSISNRQSTKTHNNNVFATPAASLLNKKKIRENSAVPTEEIDNDLQRGIYNMLIYFRGL